ncbi:unnamed protein product [Periconia digitata]|uniref:Uncharacterized protein n=1 Tax=Periconia digitata TaxID=1303443 RepID=A0A9W4USY6_9PLEO|nr:unnamed protein product [Periconia digitata]
MFPSKTVLQRSKVYCNVTTLQKSYPLAVRLVITINGSRQLTTPSSPLVHSRSQPFSSSIMLTNSNMDIQSPHFTQLDFTIDEIDINMALDAMSAASARKLCMDPESLQYNNDPAISFPFRLFSELPSNLMIQLDHPRGLGAWS